MEGRCFGSLAAPLLVFLDEILVLPLRGKRRGALTTDPTDRVPELSPGLNDLAWTDIHQLQAHAFAQLQIPGSPAVGLSPTVLIEFAAVHGYSHLEAGLFFVGDSGGVDQGDVADGDTGDQGGGGITRGLGAAFVYGLTVGVHFEDDRLPSAFPDVEGVPFGHELLAVGVDPVAGHVLAQGNARRTRQIEVIHAADPARHFGHTEHRAGIQPVPGQEPFGSQHIVGGDVVHPFGLPALAAVGSLKPAHQPATAVVKGLLLFVKSADAAAELLELRHLVQSPVQAPVEPLDHRLQFPGHAQDMLGQLLTGHHRTIGCGPALLESGGYRGFDRRAVLSNHRLQNTHIERLGTYLPFW